MAVLDGKFLQPAFAGLIADRTIERMIDQQELHHPLRHSCTIGESVRMRHAFAHVLRAGNLRTRNPGDLGIAVCIRESACDRDSSSACPFRSRHMRQLPGDESFG